MLIIHYALSSFHPIVQVITSILPERLSRRCRQIYALYLQTYEVIPSCLRVHGVTILTETKRRGGSADIHLGKLGGIKVAVKAPRRYQTNTKQVMTEFINEVMIMDSLGRHPHIINFVGISYDHEIGPTIVTSWMDYGTLTDFIRRKPRYGYSRRRLVEQIVEGMAFLKSSNVIHGDLKSSNILISNKGQACISDFGLSHFAGAPSLPTVVSGLRIAGCALSWLLQIPPSFDSTHSGAGSPRWMAPELLVPNQCQSAKSTFESDIFALGMVIYEIYSGQLPYHEANDYMAMIFIVQGKRPDRPNAIPDDLWSMTTNCWATDPSLRPPVDAIQRAIKTSKRILHNMPPRTAR